MTSAPPIGYRLATRRARLAKHTNLGLRAAVCGAEPIDPFVLRDFAAAYAQAGFKPEAFRPAYGLAEATMAVSMVPLGERARTLQVDPGSAIYGSSISVKRSLAYDEVVAEEDSVWLVSCGRALRGLSLSIRDDDGRSYPDGVVGEIWVEGASVCAGYNQTSADETFKGGVLRTGDSGFIIGALLAGAVADLFGFRPAIQLIAALTVGSGLLALCTLRD